MEINFFQNGNYYVAEFEVNTEFNLHIERDFGRKLYIYQCTSEGGDYALVNDFCNKNNQNVIDIDFTALVYPKRIKIVSDAEPTYATVATDGEVTEIKTQSKEIEITSNGITDIIPDTGFAYLNSVRVNTNVPQSGEGGGSASNMKYYSCLPDYFLGEEHEVTLVDSVKIFLQDKGSTIIAPESVYNWGSFSPVVVAVAIDVDNRRCFVNEAWMTMKDYAQRYDGFDVDTHYEISEEEYYRIPSALIMKDREDLASVYENACERLAHGGISPIYIDLNTGSTEDIDALNVPVQFWGYSSINAIMNDYESSSVMFGKYFTVEGI